jgi:hypothetical protein
VEAECLDGDCAGMMMINNVRDPGTQQSHSLRNVQITPERTLSIGMQCAMRDVSKGNTIAPDDSPPAMS